MGLYFEMAGAGAVLYLALVQLQLCVRKRDPRSYETGPSCVGEDSGELIKSPDDNAPSTAAISVGSETAAAAV